MEAGNLVEPSVWTFILFVFAELMFSVVIMIPAMIFGFAVIEAKRVKRRHFRMLSLSIDFLSYFMIFLLMYILTGQSYFFVLVGVFLVVSLLCFAAIELLWLIIGTRRIPWISRTLWADYEFQNTRPVIAKILSFAGMGVFLFFPAYIGYFYFTGEFTPDEWTRFVFKTTIWFFIGLAWVVQLPKQLFLMTSSNVMAGTRSRIFVAQIVMSIPVLLFISMFLWASGGVEAGTPFFGGYFHFSVELILWVAAYFFLVVVIPYTVGYYRSRNWIEYLDTGLEKIKKDMARKLSSPKLDQAKAAMEAFPAVIAGEMRKLEKLRGVNAGLELLAKDTSGDGPGSKDFLPQWALGDCRSRDPRFSHLEALGELGQANDEYLEEFSKQKTTKGKKELLKDYITALEKTEPVVDKKTKPLLLGAFYAIASVFVGTIISSVAETAIDYMRENFNFF